MTLAEKKEALVQKEWQNFQNVQNEGGRAFCQDDPDTFFIMRRSQFTTWSQDLVDSWYKDLEDAEKTGRNLLAEKYAWMMRQTSPEEFKKISRYLEFPNFFAEQIIEEIVKIEVKWMEEYKANYPSLASGNRYIHSSEDTAYCTSFETYLRGELYTYSDRTLRLYYDMIIQIKNNGQSMSFLIVEAMVKSYGFTSIDEAEAQEKAKLSTVF